MSRAGPEGLPGSIGLNGAQTNGSGARSYQRTATVALGRSRRIDLVYGYIPISADRYYGPGSGLSAGRDGGKVHQTQGAAGDYSDIAGHRTVDSVSSKRTA